MPDPARLSPRRHLPCASGPTSRTPWAGDRRRARARGPALSACNESSDDGGVGEAAVASAPDTQPDRALASEPSPLARRILGPGLLAEYQRVGAQIGVSWTVLAAADYVEGGASRHGSVRSAENRILAIAYTLQALNGPANYS